MPADWKRFGELLTDLLYRIEDAGGPTIAGLQMEIGHKMGKRGGDSVAKWRQGARGARLKTARANSRDRTTNVGLRMRASDMMLPPQVAWWGRDSSRLLGAILRRGSGLRKSD